MHDAYRAYERQQKLAQPRMVSDPVQFARYFKKSGVPWERPFPLRDAFPYGASFPISMLSAYTEQEFYKAIAENWMDSPSDYNRASAAVVGGPGQWEKLVKDESVLVRTAVAQYATDGFRAELLGDPDPVVRRYIARNAGDALRKALLEREQDPEVAKTACQYAGSTDTADSLVGAHWDSPQVLAACAPYMGKAALGKLSGHPDAAVRMAAAEHGGVEICRQVLIREEDVLNRNLLEELLAGMEEEEQEEQRRQAEAAKAQKKDNVRLCLWAAAQTEALVLQDGENWGKFLETAGRVYKYPYEDALLIFSQRPEAAACAEADLWSSRMGRQVVREDRAIVLAAEDKNGAYLRYVYDVSDTAGRPFPRPWQYGPRFAETVQKALRQAYGARGETLPALVESAARRLLDRQFPEAGEYRRFIESSACYMALSRCGQQPEEDFSRFLPLEGDRREIHMAARTAVQISSALLRQVERAVRETVLESHRRQRRPPAQTPGQVSFFSMELEKAEAPAPQKNSPPPEKESLKPAGLSQTVLDEALRIGANDPSSRLRIIAEFMKDKPVEENARFLQAHYKENGAGFYVGERQYALWYDGAGMLISPGESVREDFSTILTWEQAAGRIRELLDAGEYAGQVTMYRAWPFEKNRVAEALQFLHRDMNEEYKNLYLPTLTAALDNRYIYPDVVEKTKALLEQPEPLESVISEFTDFLKDYACNRGLLRFHYHRTDEILQGLKDLQLEPIKFTAAEGFTPQRRLFISQDEIDKLLREDADRHDYRLGIVKFFEQHPDKKEREKYLSGIHGVYSGFHGGNDNITYTSKGVAFSHGSITEPYAKVDLSWGKVCKRIEELIKKDAFLSAEDKEVLEGRYLEGPAADGQEATPAPTVRDLYQQYKPMVLAAVMEDTAYRNACRNSDEASACLECDAAIKRVAASASNLQFAKLYYDMQEFHARLHRDIWDETYPALSADKQETKPRYQVVVYHHFENGFDEKLDYPTLAEAEKAARRHLDGSMEEDGFQYEGAAVYDLQEKKWLWVFGHFPDEKAQEQVKTTPSAKAVPEQAPPTAEEKAPAPQEQESAPAPSLSIDPSRPYIFCEWSESEVFQDKTSYSLAEFDRLMKETDSHYVKKQAEGIEKYGSWQAVYAADDPEYSPYLGYDKVKFTLRMPDGSSYTERQDIGDGDGGVIDFLSQYEKYRDIVPILREAVRQERETPAAPPSPEEKGPVRDPDGWLVSAEDPAVQNHFPAPVQATGSGGQEKPAPAPNFRITDENLGVGGPKAHYKMNVEAIRLLRQLQAENRQATPAEQDTLSKYVGWGGLADAFDESKPAWASEYKELKGLLPPEEYESARASTLNSHYTTPVVIRVMYQALENMGFRGGRILEPSMGTGNFFGCLPESMAKSRLYGVELDSITGQIARRLYPQADITVAGFETTDRHNFYDLAIGNVPFGNYQVHDPAYNRLGFSIHNYFFAKALDQVRPGGIVAFLTSRYTLDSKDTKVRKYLAERADLLGAVRLPNNAFKDNAGTEVVSDILFLQKRESPPEQEPAWVQTGESALGFRVNQYFLDNPHMVLGAEQSTSSQYGGQDYTVAPAPGADLAGQLARAVTYIHGEYKEASPRQEEEKSVSLEDVKPYSFAVIDGEVYYREGESLEKPKLRGDAGERVKAMVSLRDCTRRLLRLQMEDAPDGEIRQAQGELNRFHHSFLERFGLINDRKNARAFDRDSSYYLLCSLEEVGKNGELKRRADIFTKRTIQPHRPVTHTETAAEALAVSLGERAKVDLPFMARLTGKAEEEIYQELKGDIFLNPLFGQGPGEEKYLSADEYLSGNVREKWQAAKEAAKGDPAFQVNAEALERVQPRPLTAAEIDAHLGAVWIEPAYIDQFMAESFGLSPAAATRTHAFYSAATGEWQVHGVHATALSERFGTTRKSAYEVLEASLNQRPVRVVDYTEDPLTHKRTGRVNERETTLARGKQQALRQAFKDWLWKDPQRRQALTARYNELYNSTRPREYDGSHLVFDGINPEIRLRKHQLDAIARTIYGGNTLLAHCVGAGKSYEIAAAAMEMKRLGLCHKSLIVVPNHIVGQWGIEFLKLYPAANILVAKETDFSAQNRKKFCARIATGNYDAVIIGHSQFAFLPLSEKRQEEGLRREIRQVEQGMKQAKKETGEGARFTIKQMERAKRSLETQMQRLQDGVKRDDVTSFEELGVDRLFIDEAHEFKNLSFVTKMGTVAGLNPEGSMKASDLLMKCRYLDEITGEKGVVLATGTPVSNSVAELYTMIRYVQNSTLQEKGWGFFDNWAAQFAETVTEAELAPEGTGYRERTRLARFTNLPELMNIFREAADIKTAEDVGLPVPEVEFHVEKARPSPEQEALVRELSARAEAVHNKMVSPAEDNLLKISTDGRRLGLDQRLLDPSLPDFPGSKINMCVAKVLDIWREGQGEKTTQLIFCDTSTPKGKAGAPQAFNVYDDIYRKLTAGGVPPEEIAFIHDYPKQGQKNALFEKVRNGEVRVLLGSTRKMGSGTNVQDRLIACHDLDCPWKPGYLEQRLGRAARQGNRNEKVHIYRYVTDATFDAFLWQTVEKKQRFISQIMTSKSPVRSFEDVDETALSYAEIKALCAGDPRIKERMELDVEVSRLKILEAGHKGRQYELENRVLLEYPREIKRLEQSIQGLESDAALRDAHPSPEKGFAGMEVLGRRYTEREAAGAALLEACRAARYTENMELGSYRGFGIAAEWDAFSQETRLILRGKGSYYLDMGESAGGMITRLENRLDNISRDLDNKRHRLEAARQDLENDRAELGRPFPQEGELEEKSRRLRELALLLDLGGKAPDIQGFAQSVYELVQACLPEEILEGVSEKGAVDSLERAVREGRFQRIQGLLAQIDRGPYTLTQKEQAHLLLEELKLLSEKQAPGQEKPPVRDDGPDR